MSEPTLSHTASLVKEKLEERYTELPKRLSRNVLNKFAIDLALVACCIRTGYLLDIFSPENPVVLFSRLLGELRADPRSEGAFRHVFHLYEPLSGQSFFVNAKLLYPRIQRLVQRDPETSYLQQKEKPVIFIQISSPIAIIDTPAGVQQLLTSFLSWTAEAVLPLSRSLPNETPVETSVPLAAILLDYPVAYVPSSSHNSVLSGVLLDFYECSLSFHNTIEKRHEEDEGMIVWTVMKFSCPAILGQAHPSTYPELQPQKIIKSLNNMFSERLKDNKDPTVQITSIGHTTHTLDNVVF